MDQDQKKVPIKIGTRSSALALRQSRAVASELERHDPSVSAQDVPVSTAGDRDKTSALSTMGKGLWTTELEDLLLNKELDCVVHSLKDLPTNMPEGCVLGCITRREDARDVLIVKSSLLESGDPAYKSLATLPEGSVIGTSSLRRSSQLRRRYPHLKFIDARGNIDTRLRKLDNPSNNYTAIVLAAAGLLRMNFGDRITEYLESDTGGILHAVGQGALGVESREGDEAMLERLRHIEDQDTMLACVTERSVMRALEGGCSVPIGVETKWVEVDGQRKLRLRTIVVSLDGSDAVEDEMLELTKTRDEAEAFGRKMASVLVEKGAQRILDAINADKSKN